MNQKKNLIQVIYKKISLIDETILDAGLKALSKMPREEAIEIALAVNKIKEQFKDLIEQQTVNTSWGKFASK